MSETLVTTQKPDAAQVFIDDDLLPMAELNLPQNLSATALRSAATGASRLGHMVTDNSFDFTITLNGMTDALERKLSGLASAGVATNPALGSFLSNHVVRVHDPALPDEERATDFFILRANFHGVPRVISGGSEPRKWQINGTACVDPSTGLSYRLGEPVAP
jgi:hypothetical protein